MCLGRGGDSEHRRVGERRGGAGEEGANGEGETAQGMKEKDERWNKEGFCNFNKKNFLGI